MKPISLRPIFTLALFTTKNQKIIKNSQILAFSTQTHQNPVWRRQEEESRGVRVSVWWDFENCNLPINTNVFRVARCITNAVRANGIKGPIQITAFGDVMQISRTNQEALSSTGINLTHVPCGGKNSADRSLLVDLMYWVSQNPPPAHLFLISGDRDFAGILHRLRMNNYNILLASPDSAPSVLCSAATIMWQWSSLLKGENLTGKLFNQPPDGPYNSWYGHYKVPLEDPFVVTEQPSCLPTDELSASSEGPPDSKVRPIPKAIMKHIEKILRPYPEGVSITYLRAELTKNNLAIDKDLYGYKKFSRFLLAMPHVLKLHSVNDGQFLVRGVSNKFFDESNIGESDGDVAKTNGETGFAEYVTEKSTVPPVQEQKVKACATNLQDLKKEEKHKESTTLKRNMQETREQERKVKFKEQPKKAEATSPVVDNKYFSDKNENQLLIPNEHQSASEFGIFRRIWMKLFGSGDINYSEKRDETLNRKDGIEEEVGPALFSPSSHEVLIDGKIARTNEAVTPISSLFNQAMSWFKLWNSLKIVNKEEKNGETVDQAKVNPIFSNESFWNEVESFIDTPEGAAAFSHSWTREQLTQNLQKYGPPILRSLPEGDLLHLIDLLISDKKWVEECESRVFPFRLTRSIGKDARNNNPNGLSHIFSNVQDSGERKHQNPPHTGVSQPISHRGSSSKPRSEILADCQKLVDHIIKEYPEGFNLGSFRKLFLEKHGYALDLQKLGYEKLVNLLHNMPGVRVESNFIVPAAALKNLEIQNADPAIQGGEKSSLSSSKDDDSDSSWDELGPIDKPCPNKQEMDTRKARMGKNERVVCNYEPPEECFSDSEEEMASSARSEKETKSSLKDQESSLLQILDSWYGHKGGSNGETTDSPRTLTSPETKNESPGPRRSTRKQKHKSYSFVTEEQGHIDSKDKLVDGILGSLKKTGERSDESRVPS